MPVNSDTQEDRLESDLRAAYPDAPLPTALEERLVQRVQTAMKPRRNVSRRIALGLVAAGVVTAIVLPTTPLFRPKRALALERIAQAFLKVHSVHMVEYAGDQKSTEKWFVPGKSRENYGTGDKLRWYRTFVGTTYTSVQLDEKTFSREDAIQEPVSPTQSISRLFRQAEKAGLGTAVENLGKKQVDGREALVIRITLPQSNYSFLSRPEQLNYTLYVDPITDLPFQIERRQTESGRWTLLTQKVSYNEQIPDSTFTPDLSGYKREDTKQISAENWDKSILGGKQIIGRGSGITLRYFEISEALGVMVWFTTDSDARPKVSLSGKGGDCPLVAQGVVGETDPAVAQRFTLDGKRLQWAFFRQSFVAPMGNGDWNVRFELAGASQDFRPNGYIGNSPIPGGAPVAEIKKLHPTLAGERNRDRAEYFLDGRWKEDAPLLELAVSGELEPNEQALIWLQLAIREDSPNLPHARDWRRMADCYDALNQPEKAREYRKKADAEDKRK